MAAAAQAIVPAREKQAELRSAIDTEKFRSALRAVLPKHLTPERVVKVALAATLKQPLLLQCSRDSLLLAIMQAAELGIEPGSALGHAYLVPFNGPNGYECQLIVGYRGLIALARRSGEIVSIEAHVVHARDAFSFRFGTDAGVTHVPFMPPPPAAEGEDVDDDPGPVVAAYGVAKIKGGGTQIEVMSRRELEEIKARSQTGRKDKGPWRSDFGEMARKTVVRRLFKYLPVSVEIASALELDAADNDNGDLTGAFELVGATGAKTLPEGASSTEQLKATLQQKQAETVPAATASAEPAAATPEETPAPAAADESESGEDAAAEAFERAREAKAKRGGAK